MRLLNPGELESSAVVANCAMNRERRLLGSNSYERELNLDILSFLRRRSTASPVSWVDLCCGTGRALVEAARELLRDKEQERFRIEGIDLAGLFDANLDLANFQDADGRPAGRAIASRLRANGLSYDARRRLVRCREPREVDFGLRYVGANADAGPNYTGQPAVDSYYAVSAV